MNTTIFSVFPACGKTWIYEHQKELGLKVLDSDSSQFSRIEELDIEYEHRYRGKNNYVPKYIKKRNPCFPDNYIKFVKENIGKYDFIFVSTHDVVRKALEKEKINFIIVYPQAECKMEWVGRCYARELNHEFGCSADAMYNNYDKWINECRETSKTHISITLRNNDFLSNHLRDFAKSTFGKMNNNGQSNNSRKDKTKKITNLSTQFHLL